MHSYSVLLYFGCICVFPRSSFGIGKLDFFIIFRLQWLQEKFLILFALLLFWFMCTIWFCFEFVVIFLLFIFFLYSLLCFSSSQLFSNIICTFVNSDSKNLLCSSRISCLANNFWWSLYRICSLLIAIGLPWSFWSFCFRILKNQLNMIRGHPFIMYAKFS